MERLEEKLMKPKLLAGLSSLLICGCDYGESLLDQLRWGAPYLISNNFFNPQGVMENTLTYLAHAFTNAGFY